MGQHIKMDCKNIFNKKKTHAIYHSNSLSGVCHICLLSLIYNEVWSGLEAFWKTFKKKGRGRKPSEQSLDDSLCCFSSNWITSWCHFFPAFSCLITKWKIKTIHSHYKSLKKGFGLIKVVIHFSFYLRNPYPHSNLNTFHEIS